MERPKIVGFLCNWCSYAGADLAGVSRFSYPTNIRIIRVMCSGRIDPGFILTALERGLDGVLVAGCHPGDCHYLSGNYQAKYKIRLVQRILQKIGFDIRRVRLEWVSAAEGRKFADLITEFTEELKRIGPTPLKNDLELRDRLTDAKQVCNDFRLRWIISRARDITEIENAYGERIPEERFKALLDEWIDAELIRTRILKLIEAKALSAEEISRKIQTPTEEVMEHLISLTDEQKIEYIIENHTAIFSKVGGDNK